MAKNKQPMTRSKHQPSPSAQAPKPAPALAPPRPVTMTRDQLRAAWAYAILDGEVALHNPKDLRTLANGLPAAMLRSGLLGALAFTMRYQNDKAAAVVLDALVEGLRPLFTDRQLPSDLKGVKLAKRLTESDGDGPLFNEDDYILASREALHLATWLKRAIAGDPRYGGED